MENNFEDFISETSSMEPYFDMKFSYIISKQSILAYRTTRKLIKNYVYNMREYGKEPREGMQF